MVTLHIDLETYSSIELSEAGLYKYTQAPDFEILLLHMHIMMIMYRLLILLITSAHQSR